MNKRGASIAIYVIIGMIIVISALIYTSSKKKEVSQVIDRGTRQALSIASMRGSLQFYVTDCIKQTAILGRNNCGVDNCDIYIKDYIKENIMKCTAGFTAFSELGFTVKDTEYDEISVESKITDDSMIINLHYPVALLKSGDVTNIDNFQFQIKRDATIESPGGIVPPDTRIDATDGNGRLLFNPSVDTIITDSDGNPVDEVSLTFVDKNFDGLSNNVVLGTVVYDGKPDGVHFNPCVIMEQDIKESNIPAGLAPSDVKLGWFDKDNEIWKTYNAQLDPIPKPGHPGEWIISACVDHFTPTAVVNCGSANTGYYQLNLYDVIVPLFYPSDRWYWEVNDASKGGTTVNGGLHLLPEFMLMSKPLCGADDTGATGRRADCTANLDDWDFDDQIKFRGTAHWYIYDPSGHNAIFESTLANHQQYVDACTDLCKAKIIDLYPSYGLDPNDINFDGINDYVTDLYCKAEGIYDSTGAITGILADWSNRECDFSKHFTSSYGNYFDNLNIKRDLSQRGGTLWTGGDKSTMELSEGQVIDSGTLAALAATNGIFFFATPNTYGFSSPSDLSASYDFKFGFALDGDSCIDTAPVVASSTTPTPSNGYPPPPVAPASGSPVPSGLCPGCETFSFPAAGSALLDTLCTPNLALDPIAVGHECKISSSDYPAKIMFYSYDLTEYHGAHLDLSTGQTTTIYGSITNLGSDPTLPPLPTLTYIDLTDLGDEATIPTLYGSGKLFALGDKTEIQPNLISNDYVVGPTCSDTCTYDLNGNNLIKGGENTLTISVENTIDAATWAGGVLEISGVGLTGTSFGGSVFDACGGNPADQTTIQERINFLAFHGNQWNDNYGRESNELNCLALYRDALYNIDPEILLSQFGITTDARDIPLCKLDSAAASIPDLNAPCSMDYTDPDSGYSPIGGKGNECPQILYPDAIECECGSEIYDSPNSVEEDGTALPQYCCGGSINNDNVGCSSIGVSASSCTNINGYPVPIGVTKYKPNGDCWVCENEGPIEYPSSDPKCVGGATSVGCASGICINSPFACTDGEDSGGSPTCLSNDPAKPYCCKASVAPVVVCPPNPNLLTQANIDDGCLCGSSPVSSSTLVNSICCSNGNVVNPGDSCPLPPDNEATSISLDLPQIINGDVCCKDITITATGNFAPGKYSFRFYDQDGIGNDDLGKCTSESIGVQSTSITKQYNVPSYIVPDEPGDEELYVVLLQGGCSSNSVISPLSNIVKIESQLCSCP